MNQPILFSLSSLPMWISRYKPWLWRLVLWSIVAVFTRLILVGAFYRDTPTVMLWLSVGIVVQTISIYYFFGYFVLPRYVYRLKVVAALSWLAFGHALVYESNYFLFWNLQTMSNGPRLERDWSLFHQAGLFGWIMDTSAAFYSFFYSFPFALMFLTYLAVKDILNYRTKNLLLEKEKLTLELDFLRSQINPHSLFNVLNSVYADVFETNEKAADLVLRLSELMRYNLYEADVSKIALDKELAYVQNYLDLERNRLGEQDISIDYAHNGPIEQYQISPLLLIGFVENAFKHGVKGAVLAAYVEVYASVEGGTFTFQVENSVPPKRQLTAMAGEKTVKSGGVGLGNVRRRLNALYDGQYELVVRSEENSYSVVLTMRLDPMGRE